MISRASISSNLQTQTPVRIIDFVLPECGDRINASPKGQAALGGIASATEPYTVRDGLFKDITANGGTVSDGTNAWIGGGFSFKFEELVLRHD